MRLEIKTLRLENFKGCSHKEIVFNGSAKLIGQNGSFKTTTADAFYWVFANTNTALVKEPNVIPIGAEECNPTVEIECLIDGKPLTVKRVQKFRTKEVDGKITSSSTSIYSINDIDKSYRDYVADLTAKGIDMENFLIYSNPNSFLADTSKSGRDKIRKVLFQMAQEFTDLDIAKVVGAVDVIKLMEEKGYTLEEIKASSQASIKKIETENGKKNELIDARIQGLIEGKVDYNLAELTARELELKSRIENIKEEIKILADISNDIRISELKNKIAEIWNKAVAEFYEKRKEHMAKHNELIDRYRDVETIINTANKVIFENEKGIENCNTLLESLRIDYDSVFNKQYDGSSTCPVCKQELPKLMVADAKANFEADKARNLSSIQSAAARVHRDIDDKEKLIADAKETISRVTPSLEMLKGQLEDWEKVSITEPRLEDIPEIAPLQAEIKALEEETVDSSQERFDKLDKALASAEAAIIEVQSKLKALENNEVIDEKIEVLREKKRNDEIAKADMEKRLYEVTEVEKAKNKSLSDSINSHFNIINFKLFDYLKNGNYTETVEILIDGKPMTSCANGSLIQLAKIDCIDGLQTFFNQHMPVFVEDAALITANTEQRIKLDSQLIQLIAKDGVDTLQIERG